MTKLRQTISRITRKTRDAFLYQGLRFFRLRDSKDRAARGFAIGLSCNFLPTFGLGGFISGFLARLFGGNIVAGFIGGSVLALFWPILFLLNIKVGGFFLRPPIPVDDLEDVTPQTVDALVWGQTFAIGAILNGVVAGLIAYFAFLLLYERIRPRATRWFLRQIRLRRLALLKEAQAGAPSPTHTS